MRIFKTQLFAKWAQNESLTDQTLVLAITDMNAGLVDASLGGCVYKKRVAKRGHGKSGSYRTLIAFKIKDSAFFMYGFSKNQRENITSRELVALKRYASELLGYNDAQLTITLKNGELIEVKNDG